MNRAAQPEEASPAVDDGESRGRRVLSQRIALGKLQAYLGAMLDDLTVAQAAEALGASRQTVRTLLRTGELQGRREPWGRRYVWVPSRKGVDDFLSQNGRLDGRRRQHTRTVQSARRDGHGRIALYCCGGAAGGVGARRHAASTRSVRRVPGRRYARPASVLPPCPWARDPISCRRWPPARTRLRRRLLLHRRPLVRRDRTTQRVRAHGRGQDRAVRPRRRRGRLCHRREPRGRRFADPHHLDARYEGGRRCGFVGHRQLLRLRRPPAIGRRSCSGSIGSRSA